MLDTRKLRALEEMQRRKEAAPVRDAVLGWAGFVIVGALTYLVLTDGPTPAERAARDAQYAEQQAIREENARIACASGVLRACEELR